MISFFPLIGRCDLFEFVSRHSTERRSLTMLGLIEYTTIAIEKNNSPMGDPIDRFEKWRPARFARAWTGNEKRDVEVSQ